MILCLIDGKGSDGESTFTICRTENIPQIILHKLRGMGQTKWKMAPEQRTESAVGIRLRQVPPVIADRVTDLKRFVLRGAGEEKWYHGRAARLLTQICGGKAGFLFSPGSF